MRLAAVILMLTLSPATGQEKPAATEAQVRRDCTFDALRYCKATIGQGSRAVIIACMLENRDRLQAKCSRHLH